MFILGLRLTVTKVVFELKMLSRVSLYIVRLTVTKVVFELKINSNISISSPD